jgi:hypothetical protein
MKRRTCLRTGAVAGLTVTAGCLGFGDGGDRGDDDQVGHRITDGGGEGQYLLNRVDFVDQAGTLGQLDHMENDKEVDNLVNTYSEEEWQRMDANDLDVARRTLENNDSSVEQIRPWVEDTLDRKLEGYPDLESVDAPPGPEEPDERAIMYGIGMGMGEESAISNSFDSAHVLKPLAEHFAGKYLNNDVFETWITGAAIPATQNEFAHLPVTMAYSHGGEIRRDYVEDAVPDTAGIGEHAIRSPEESIYSDEDAREYVTGHEYSKALEMAQNGNIRREEYDHPIRAISRNLLGNMWGMVDSARNDISYESPPPNGLVNFVSKEFGRSVEDAFYDLDERKLQYMENIGRGMQLFYEEHTGRTNLAVGGTLEKPAFYEFPDEMKEQLWNFEYDSLAELEG